MRNHRITELLEVEVGERFAFKGFPDIGTFHIDAGGNLKSHENTDAYPEVIKAIMEAIGYGGSDIVISLKWKKKDIDDAKMVKSLFGNVDVYRDADGTYIGNGGLGGKGLGLSIECFPSLKKGERTRVNKIIEAEELIKRYGST